MTRFNMVLLSVLTRHANDVIPARTTYRSGTDVGEIVPGAQNSTQVRLSATVIGTAPLSSRGDDDRIVISCGETNIKHVILLTNGRSGITIAFIAAHV